MSRRGVAIKSARRQVADPAEVLGNEKALDFFAYRGGWLRKTLISEGRVLTIVLNPNRGTYKYKLWIMLESNSSVERMENGVIKTREKLQELIDGVK